MNSHRFKLDHAYSISFNSSNVGKRFWSWILKDCIKVQEKNRKLLSCVPGLDKTWIQALSRAKLLFLLIKPIAFGRSRCRPRRRCLSSLLRIDGGVMIDDVIMHLSHDVICEKDARKRCCGIVTFDLIGLFHTNNIIAYITMSYRSLGGNVRY